MYSGFYTRIHSAAGHMEQAEHTDTLLSLF